MSVILLRPYSGFAAGVIVTFDPATEAALVSQAFANYTSATAINPAAPPSGTPGAQILGIYGPAILPNLSLGTAALTAAGASSVNVANNMHLSDIFVPHWNTWKGLAVLNGTVVGTDNMFVALYNSCLLYTSDAADDM
jgi:hypothetical protein